MTKNDKYSKNSFYFTGHKTFLFFIISCLQFIVLSFDLEH